jgi:hypothetical protein
MRYAGAVTGGFAMRVFLMATLCLALSAPALAQTSDTDPPTRDEVEIYLQTMHSHDMMQKTMEAMLKPMHQMFRDQFAKDGKALPPGAERRANKIVDEMMKGMPLDEMTQALVPVYQKHFTKGDLEKLIAFYSSPIGQKVLTEMPAITGESMEAIMPGMQKYIAESQSRMQQEVKELEKNAPQQ